MSVLAQSLEKTDAKGACEVVVVYDGAAARDRAMKVCDHLLLQFDGDIAFNFNWWRMDFLEEADFANLSASQAGLADILIVCTNPDNPPARHFENWIASWTSKNTSRSGVLVDLTSAAGKLKDCTWATKHFLREAARKAGLDYLDDSICGSAANISLTLESTFSELPAPEHSGLNE